MSASEAAATPNLDTILKIPVSVQIVEHLTREYEVDPARCRADVAALLDRLQEARLVKAG